MNAKANRLCAAILGVLGASAAPVANSVSVDARGTGQVLLFPYYTANGGNQTLLSVVNTTDRVKAVKVRFRESLNSRMVYDFNLYLAPFDTWSGAVFADSADGVAKIVSADTSCALVEFLPGQPREFRNYQYTGSQQDFPSSQPQLGALSRTREGHIEMIDMGELRTGTARTQLAEEASFERIAAQPRDCAPFRAEWIPPAGSWFIDGQQDIDPPTGGLMGSAAIVDVAEGAMVSYAATALADFYTDATVPGLLHNSPGSDHPLLTDANNGGGAARAELDVDGVGAVGESFPTARQYPDAVSLVLMRTTLLNDFVADAALGAATEWVVTFPTRSYYTDLNSSFGEFPFSDGSRNDTASPESALRTMFDRESVRAEFNPGCDFGGVPPPGCGPPGFTLDHSVNVLAFSPRHDTPVTPILGAIIDRNAQWIPTSFPTREFASGWLRLAFYDPPYGTTHVIVGPSTGRAYRGLPAIGFAATRIVNTAARPGLIANYAGAQPLRGTLEAPLVQASPETRDPKP